jgi:hypothetical protein
VIQNKLKIIASGIIIGERVAPSGAKESLKLADAKLSARESALAARLRVLLRMPAILSAAGKAALLCEALAHCFRLSARRGSSTRSMRCAR